MKKNKLGLNQATLKDYQKESSKYDRGHLNPSSGHNTVESATATFTLTNVIPQVNSFNQQCWKFFEQAIFKHVNRGQRHHQNICVVGAVPGFNVMNGRVNIPSYMWSTVQSEGNVIAVLVPNMANDKIQEKKLMTLFWFSEKKLPEFINDIKTLYTAINAQGLTKKVEKLTAKSEYFEGNVDFFAGNELNQCLAQYPRPVQTCWMYFKRAAVQYVNMMNCNQDHVIIEGDIQGFLGTETEIVDQPSYIWATVTCRGNVVAYLVPNVNNNQIEEKKLMTLFHFSESKLPSFNDEIKALKNSSSQEELQHGIMKLTSQSKYFEGNLPEIFSEDKELQGFLAPFGLNTQDHHDEF